MMPQSIVHDNEPRQWDRGSASRLFSHLIKHVYVNKPHIVSRIDDYYSNCPCVTDEFFPFHILLAQLQKIMTDI
jgi:hypothetical protein